MSRALPKQNNRNSGDETSRKAIGRRLQKFRRYKGLPQTTFCKPLGIFPNMWSEYERGVRRIPLNAAIKLWQRHSLALDWIYFGKTDGLPKALADALDQFEDVDEPSSR